MTEQRVVFIMRRAPSKGIKLRSESEPEQALQHVFKQKSTGRRALTLQAAFFVVT